MSKNSKDCPKASTFLILSSREQSCLRRRSKEKAIRIGHEVTTRRYSKTSLTTSARLMFLFPSEGRLLIIRRVPLDKSQGVRHYPYPLLSVSLAQTSPTRHNRPIRSLSQCRVSKQAASA